jgi:molybdenum cofactor cytidylyltransferase
VRQHEGVFKKGRILSAADIALLSAAGHTNLTVARLGVDDIPEDKAARALALAVAGQGSVAQQAFTGRANVHAEQGGLALIDIDRVRAINHLHESLTIATLGSHVVVSPKQMLATVKIIPFATPQAVLEKALAIVGGQPLLQVRLFQRRLVSLVITRLPQSKSNIVAKSEQSIRLRLEALGLALSHVVTVEHQQKAVAKAVAELAAKGSDCILVFGASAIVDRGDIIPAGLVEAGGEVVHLGMPVDPGNLLMLGLLNTVPVIGVPSCARSPKRNGFDWVLERVMAGISVTGADIMDMGAGGLLAEIPSRPSPRELNAAPRVVAIVLAAGKSTRMGSHKMLAEVDGRPMLKVVVEYVLSTSVDEVIVVTGHGAADCEAALAGLNVRLVHNADYATGLASSLRVGVAAAGKADAVLVCLGDMPRVGGNVIDRMIAAFNPTEHRSIVLPSFQGEIGNPVLWGAEHFQRLLKLAGDKGARRLIAEIRSEATEVEVDDAGVLQDVDTVGDLDKIMALDVG